MNIFGGNFINDFTAREIVKEKTEVEIEHVLIVDVLDIKEIEDRAEKVVKMEQWELKTSHGKGDNPGTIRIRAIDDKEYIGGIKQYIPSGDGPSKANEYEFKMDKEGFEIFKGLAPMGTIKKRHYFKSGGLVFEVDIFYNANGELASNWVKIDIEVKSDENIRFTPDHLPFKVAQIIQEPRSKEDNLKVNKIFNKEFNQFNENNMLPIDCK